MAILRFQNNQTEVVALNSEAPQDEKSNFGARQKSFQTVNGEKIYMNVAPAEEMLRSLKHYGIEVGQPFRLTKITNEKWVVQPPPVAEYGHDERNGYRFPVAPPPAGPPTPAVPPQTAQTDPQRMAAKFVEALEAIKIAQEYARSQGIGITFTSDNVTSAALSAYINASRNGGR